MADDREALKARIRALLSRTTTRGCTEAEALTAFAKAQELMRQHGMSQEDVEIGRVVVSLGRQARSVVDALWPTVAHACRCRCYIEVGMQRSVVYLGRLPWPDVAQWMHEVVAGATARASRDFGKSAEAKRRRTARTRAQAKQAFMLGFVAALNRNILTLVGQHDEAAEADIAAAQRAIEALGPMRSQAPMKVGRGAAFSDARSAGFDAGRQAQVRWGVNGGTAPRLIGGGHD